MRVGVVPNLDRSGGGIYQYAVTLVSVLPRVLHPDDELTVFLYGGERLPDDLAAQGYRCVEMRAASGPAGRLWYRVAAHLPPGLRRTVRRALGRTNDPRATGAGESGVTREALVDPAWRSFFASHGIDLLVFTTDVDLAYRTGVPYVVAVHDIQHRLQPEFPEVSADGEWERREFRIGNCVRFAEAVLVDSEVGREDILEAYSPCPDAVHVVPFIPASYLKDAVSAEEVTGVRSSLQLPPRFLFYPAAFWPHKNHQRIVEALALLRQSGLAVPIVFVGPSGGPQLRRDTFAAVMTTARDLGVDDLVHYPGYVDDDTMSGLYAGAAALVMPTFFGPTNIPVLEAFQFGCPVITSDIRGIREQVGDAAVLVDPRSAAAIAEGIRQVLEDEDLAARLRQAGRAHLASYSESAFTARIATVLDQTRTALARRAGGERAC